MIMIITYDDPTNRRDATMELLLNPEGTLIDNSPCMAAGIDFACRLLTGRGPVPQTAVAPDQSLSVY